MEEILLKLEAIQRNGLAVEEATKEELIEFITELKHQIDEVIKVVESNIEESKVDETDCSCDFLSRIVDEYHFAQSKDFDSIVIVIETSGGDYEISEYENGFINDNLDGVYSTIDEIAYDLKSLIEMNGDKIEGFRIE